MRIKSLLFCLLAVCTISLSSCKQKDGEEDRNYADDFKGTYTMSMTPSISLSAPVLGEMEAPIEPVDGLKCSITGTIKNKAIVILLLILLLAIMEKKKLKGTLINQLCQIWLQFLFCVLFCPK